MAHQSLSLSEVYNPWTLRFGEAWVTTLTPQRVGVCRIAVAKPAVRELLKPVTCEDLAKSHRLI